jgi:hypothetical protein
VTILERDAQLDDISALVEKASDGGRVVLVRGGAGMHPEKIRRKCNV